jgi:transcriptional activator protein UGA3
MLQCWAADCLNVSSAQNTDPFQSLSDLLGIENDLTGSSQSAGPSRQRSVSPGHHGPLLVHYQRSLSSLVSCTGDTAPSAFDAFSQLADAQSSSKAGRGLHLSILAWAGRHMSNEGEIRYEASSERLGQKATGLIVDRLEYYQKGSVSLEETERMTLLAGCLMIIQWRVRQSGIMLFNVC